VFDVVAPSADALSVSGELSVAGTGTVTVRLPAQAGALSAIGPVPVFTFGTLSGAQHLSAWPVAGLPSGYSARLFVAGQTVYLTVTVDGTLLMVR